MFSVNTLYQQAITATYHDEEDLKSYKGRLYHYTTPQGLLGILCSQRIWATESSYLNNINEIEYGLRIAQETLETLTALNSGFEKRIIKGTINRLSSKPDEIYVACFSEEQDLLSQWKGYSNFGSGYAIEFDSTELSRYKRKFPSANISIQRVEYDPSRQQELTAHHSERIITECNRLLALSPKDESEIEQAGAFALSHILHYKAQFFKDCAFREEREWRAVYVNRKDSEEGRQEIQFRTSGYSIVPYLPPDLGPSAQKNVWNLPISAIVLGSCLNRLNAEKSITLICKNKGMDTPELKISKIPLR
jgi:Protein of unknown function (DUF2971)